jgi:arylsulfatase A-like enzyme
VRDGRWKLIEWFEDGGVELYDLDADPGETRDLVDERPEIAARMRAMLRGWRLGAGAWSP